MSHRSIEKLATLLEGKSACTLPEIQVALDDASRATVFRYLRKIPYRRSYNYNGRYYTRHDPSRYDRFGLLAFKGIYFSREGSLKATVYRLVREAEAGRTHRELLELLRVRVQFILVEAVRQKELDRDRVEGVYVYLNKEPTVKAAQLQRRQELIKAADEVGLEDALVIQVLLVLIRHPGSTTADVVRRLRGHAPPISAQQVRAVFTRYDLGEKKGATIS